MHRSNGAANDQTHVRHKNVREWVTLTGESKFEQRAVYNVTCRLCGNWLRIVDDREPIDRFIDEHGNGKCPHQEDDKY